MLSISRSVYRLACGVTRSGSISNSSTSASRNVLKMSSRVCIVDSVRQARRCAVTKAARLLMLVKCSRMLRVSGSMAML
ncbi:hypothetical protein D3C71_1918220 [compost metagenome]